MKYHIIIKNDQFDKIVLKKNLKYKDLAEKLKISSAYLSLVKSNKYPDYRPSAELRNRMLKILKVKFDDIFTLKIAK